MGSASSHGRVAGPRSAMISSLPAGMRLVCAAAGAGGLHGSSTWQGAACWAARLRPFRLLGFCVADSFLEDIDWYGTIGVAPAVQRLLDFHSPHGCPEQ